MKHAIKVTLAAAVAAVLGLIAATIWIGAAVKEETIVSNPYEAGLRYDADRRARAALGWDVRLPPAPDAPGPAALGFSVADRAGRPVEGATVTVSAGRPQTSRGVQTVAAQGEGAGRYAASIDFTAPGPWLLRFDVRRGDDRVQIEKVVEVGAGACDPAAGPCARPLPAGGEVTLELGPGPLRTMRDLALAAEVRQGGRPVDGATVTVAFSMKGMEMGRNAVTLAPRGAGRYAGRAVLVRCPSGRRDWTAEVSVARAGAAPDVARFDLRVAE